MHLVDHAPYYSCNIFAARCRMGQESRTLPKLTRAAARRKRQLEESLAVQGPPPKATGTFWSVVRRVPMVLAESGGDTQSLHVLAGDPTPLPAIMDASQRQPPPVAVHSPDQPCPTMEAAGNPVDHEPSQVEPVVQRAVQSAFAAVVGVPESAPTQEPVHEAQGHESDADMHALPVPEVGDSAGGSQVAKHSEVQPDPMPPAAVVPSPEHAQLPGGTQETPSMSATSSFQVAPGAVLGRIRDPAGNFKMAEIPFRC